MKKIPFLMAVWNHTAKQGDFLFLSTKDSKTGKWKDHPFVLVRGIRGKLREFFKKYPASRYDLYFCPLSFNQRRRVKSVVNDINILWSDIDEGKPKIKPTVLWESSPGRLQALWFLRGKSLEPGSAESLNKSLSYYNGADKGGWDITQVLRIPGTRNHKYRAQPEVTITEIDTERLYSAGKLRRRMGTKEEKSREEITPQTASHEEILSKYRRSIPPRIKRLLAQKHVDVGKRSDIIWYIENKLNEVGLSPNEIITLIKHSAWNKYKDRSDEDERLRKELEKIIESDTERHDMDEEEVDEQLFQGFTIESYSDVMSRIDSYPGWMVQDIWMNRSHGIVAGEPKSFKSTLALDLAVSVASGRPFLGEYEIVHSGPVLYIQNENARWIMKDRMGKISAHRGLLGKVHEINGKKIKVEWSPDIPLFMVNQQSFLLSDPMHQKLLVKMIEEIKPVMIILDPLYLMFDGDVNSARELNPVLSWLLEIRYEYDCGVMLIHHYNKGNNSNSGGPATRGGQRMLGSTTLHGWIESAWYVQTTDTKHEDNAMSTIHFDREYRGAGMFGKLDVTLSIGEIGSADYEVDVQFHKEVTVKEKGDGKKKDKKNK